MAPQSYKISVPQAKIDKLKAKLALAEFPDEQPNSAWDMGPPLADMKRLVKAWENYDWRKDEEKLNQTLPQFHTGIKVDGFEELDIHFIWQKSEMKNAIPLLFVHGWPGSFLEVEKLLPLLSAPSGPAFHIVAPSLPNFGFSASVTTRGFAIAQYAETCHKLMLSLGYSEYVTQGGDWGFYITRALGILYPEAVKASHINMLQASAPTVDKHPVLAAQHTATPYTESEKRGFERTKWFTTEGQGYSAEQATKPQTLAFSLNDSPAGLLAWIYEKLHDWTDSYSWTDDEILRWVSIYAFSTAGPGAAHRIYFETKHTKPEDPITRDRVAEWVDKVPLGIAFNPKELRVIPASWARTLGPVVYESHNETGGHFMATENPGFLARDLRTMFGRDGGAFGVVKGKNGYDEEVSRL